MKFKKAIKIFAGATALATVAPIATMSLTSCSGINLTLKLNCKPEKLFSPSSGEVTEYLTITFLGESATPDHIIKPAIQTWKDLLTDEQINNKLTETFENVDAKDFLSVLVGYLFSDEAREYLTGMDIIFYNVNNKISIPIQRFVKIDKEFNFELGVDFKYNKSINARIKFNDDFSFVLTDTVSPYKIEIKKGEMILEADIKQKPEAIGMFYQNGFLDSFLNNKSVPIIPDIAEILSIKSRRSSSASWFNPLSVSEITKSEIKVNSLLINVFSPDLYGNYSIKPTFSINDKVLKDLDLMSVQNIDMSNFFINREQTDTLYSQLGNFVHTSLINFFVEKLSSLFLANTSVNYTKSPVDNPDVYFSNIYQVGNDGKNILSADTLAYNADIFETLNKSTVNYKLSNTEAAKYILHADHSYMQIENLDPDPISVENIPNKLPSLKNTEYSESSYKNQNTDSISFDYTPTGESSPTKILITDWNENNGYLDFGKIKNSILQDHPVVQVAPLTYYTGTTINTIQTALPAKNIGYFEINNKYETEFHFYDCFFASIISREVQTSMPNGKISNLKIHLNSYFEKSEGYNFGMVKPEELTLIFPQEFLIK